MAIPKINGVYAPPPVDNGSWAYEVAYMQTEDLQPGGPFASQQRLLDAGKQFTKGYRLAMDRAMEAAELLDRFAASKSLKVIPESGQGYNSPSDALIDTVTKKRFSKSELELALGRIQVLNTHAKNINDDPDITGYNTWVNHSVRDARESDLTKGDFADIDRFSGDNVVATDYANDVDGDGIPDVPQAQFRDMSAARSGDVEQWSKKNSQYLTDIRAGRTPRGDVSWGAQNLHSSGADAGSTVFPRQLNGKPLVTLHSSWGTTENPITPNSVLAPGGGGMGKPFDAGERSPGNWWPDVLDNSGLVTGGPDMTLRDKLKEEANIGGVNLPSLSVNQDGLTNMDGNGTQIDNPYGPSMEELNSSFRDDPGYIDGPLAVLGGGAAEIARWTAANVADSRVNPLRWKGDEYSFKNPRLNVDTPGGVNPLRDSRFAMGLFHKSVEGVPLADTTALNLNERLAADQKLKAPNLSAPNVEGLNERLVGEADIDNKHIKPTWRERLGFGGPVEIDADGKPVKGGAPAPRPAPAPTAALLEEAKALNTQAITSRAAYDKGPTGYPKPVPRGPVAAPFGSDPAVRAAEIDTRKLTSLRSGNPINSRHAPRGIVPPDVAIRYGDALHNQALNPPPGTPKTPAGFPPADTTPLLEDRRGRPHGGGSVGHDGKPLVAPTQHGSDTFKNAVDSYLKGGYKTRTRAQTEAWVAKLEKTSPRAFAFIEAEAKARANPAKTALLKGKVGKLLGAAAVAAMIHHTASGASSTTDSLMEGDFDAAKSDAEKFLWGAADFANPLALGAIGAEPKPGEFDRSDLSIYDNRPWGSEDRIEKRLDLPNRIQDAQQFERQEQPVYKQYNELERKYLSKVAYIHDLDIDPGNKLQMLDETKRERGVWIDLPNEPGNSPFMETGGYWTHNPQDYDDDQQARHEVGDPYDPRRDPSPSLY